MKDSPMDVLRRKKNSSMRLAVEMVAKNQADACVSSGNTGALLLINKNLFSKVNGFNPNYTECFEDVELNLEVLKLNKTNILCHSAVAYHYESKSRNKDNKKIERLQNDYKERLFPFVSKNISKLQKHIKII